MTDKKKRVIGLLMNLIIVFIFFWISKDSDLNPERSLMADLAREICSQEYRHSLRFPANVTYLFAHLIALVYAWRWRAKSMELLLSFFNKI